MHTAVRWLSRANCHNQFYQLRAFSEMNKSFPQAARRELRICHVWRIELPSRLWIVFSKLRTSSAMKIDSIVSAFVSMLRPLYDDDDDVVLHHTLPIFMGLGWCPIVSWDFAGAVSIFGLDALPVVHQWPLPGLEPATSRVRVFTPLCFSSWLQL